MYFLDNILIIVMKLVVHEGRCCYTVSIKTAKHEEDKMGFKLNIVTVDDGEIEEILGSANDALDYLCDKVDPELVGQMKLTTPSGEEVSGYYTICEWLVKSE